jgi:hypothetical protein
MPTTKQRRGRQTDDCRGGRWTWVAAGIGLASLLWPASHADARLLDITGETSLEYRLLNIDTGSTDKSSSDLRETVRAGTNGELFRDAIGRYQLSLDFVNDDYSNASFPWQGSGRGNTQVVGYFASATLLPRWMPVSLTFQRVTQDQESNGGAGGPAPGVSYLTSSSTTTSTYGLGWALPKIWKLPQMQLNLYYSRVETHGCPVGYQGCQQTFKTFGGSLSAMDQYPSRYVIKNTVLTWSLVFSSIQDFGDNGGTGGLNVGGRATADTQWSPVLTSNLRASYTTNVSRQTSTVPGGIASATSAGATLNYRPSLKLTSSLSYDFAKDVYDRHVLGSSVFYRPTPQLDITGILLGSFYDLTPARVLTGSGGATVVYRPILNLSTMFSATLGDNLTTNSAATQSRSQTFFQNYGASMNYFKVYELVRVNTGAGLGVANVTGAGSDTTTVNGNWLAQVTNTKTQYVAVTGTYNGFYQQSSGSIDNMTNAVRVDASSSYFRELLLRGDVLTLYGSASDQATTQTAANDQLIDLSLNFRYGWQGVGVGSGYAMHFSTSATGEDYDAYFIEMQWGVPPLVSNMSLMLHGRYYEQLMRDHTQPNQTTAVADVTGGYQIGLVIFSLQYQFNYYDSSTSTLSHNLYLKLTRRFSF